jgi:hypothetical protein
VLHYILVAEKKTNIKLKKLYTACRKAKLPKYMNLKRVALTVPSYLFLPTE